MTVTAPKRQAPDFQIQRMLSRIGRGVLISHQRRVTLNLGLAFGQCLGDQYLQRIRQPLVIVTTEIGTGPLDETAEAKAVWVMAHLTQRAQN